jgi:hypothetical protein
MRAVYRAGLWACVVMLALLLSSGVGAVGTSAPPASSPAHLSPMNAANSRGVAGSAVSSSTGRAIGSSETTGVAATIPSAAPATSYALSSQLRELQAAGASRSTLSMVQRIAEGVQSGAISPRSLLLPNLNEFLGATATPSSKISQQYTQSPAPMGIADFGLGAKTYEYNTSSILGTVDLSSYNATSGSLYEPSGQYYWNGNPANETGNPYDSGIQLNTVEANVTFPGSSSDPLGSGVFWTQNVPSFYGNTIGLIDNVWNFSAPGAAMDPGTLYSYNGTLVPYAYYYDVGPTFPVVYPISLRLYNNASIIGGRSSVSFGYRLVEGNGQVYTGIYDTVVFNSPSPPTIQPQFRVDGFALTPSAPISSFDAELVFCGPSDGSNAMITNLSGSMTLQYLPTGSSRWASVPSAYDYGTNTGETAMGVAAYWSGHTVYVNQGPSLLYGLWNTPSKVRVPSGSIQFTSTSDPNYAFTFIGETRNGSSALQEWAPSDAAGVVTTFLPPSIAGSTAYSVAAYAAEYANYAGPSFTSTDTHYAVTMTSSPGTLDAPLYMNGEAQATALALAVDGSAKAPYTFQNLVDDVGLPFNVLNDWEFPTFSLFKATGVSTPLLVDNVAQGPNSPNGTLYFYPSPGDVANFTGATCPNGYCYLNFPNLTQEFVDYGGSGDTFTNLALPGVGTVAGLPMGGAISLWGTQDVSASNLGVTNESYGVWASAATNTSVTGSAATTDGSALTVVASWGATGRNDRAAGPGSDAVFDMGGTSGTFSRLSATGGAAAFLGISDQGTTLEHVGATGGSTGVEDYFGSGLDVNVVHVTGNSQGVATEDDQQVTVSYVSATDSSIGVALYGSEQAKISRVVVSASSTGVLLNTTANVTITHVQARDLSLGVNVTDSSNISVFRVFAGDYSTGVLIIGSSQIIVSHVFAWDHSVGVSVQNSSGVQISKVHARDHSIRIERT